MKPTLGWAADVMGVGARVVAAEGLRAGRGPWRLRVDRRGRELEAVLRIGDPNSREQLATEAAALAFAEDHGLPAPRLLAVDVDGAAAGRPALLMTVLPGTSKIPTIAPTARLWALGVAAAALHTVATAPHPDLPLRVRPLADVDFAAKRRATGSSPLLEAAEERIKELTPPESAMVFVHGDLWQGNTMWIGDSYVGMIDWDAAGVGHPGIDLGSLRCDAAIVFGLPAATQILNGWQHATGQDADAVAYWDVVAAQTTPTHMTEWLPVARDHGRVDLDATTLMTRRDAFLRAALDRLDRE
jgi:aminoglycoside phosphotransferase (APT) family kinase protein